MREILFLSALLLQGCQNAPMENAKPMEKPPIIGGDSDEHGCKASAGYTWSNTRNSCVRVWEVGVRLKPSKNSSNQDFIVIRNGDAGPLEVYGNGFHAAVFKGKNPIWYNDSKSHIIRIQTPITGKRVMVLCKIEANGNEVALADAELD